VTNVAGNLPVSYA